MGLDEPTRERSLATLTNDLFTRDLLEPLTLGGADERLWLDCELASFAEHRLGDTTSPHDLTPAHRTHWCAQAITEPLWSPRHRVQYDHLYWLRSRGQRVGTLALSAGVGRASSIRAASLYVFPTHRRQGMASTVLRTLRDGLHCDGLALRFDTIWTWQPVVRMYLRMGAWVHMWKHELSLRLDGSMPAPLVDFDGDHATMSIELDGALIPLHRAQRQGDRLVLDVLPSSDHPCAEALRWDSSSTFALALALQGWPLIRSQADWMRFRSADAGPPEALAYRIIQWEAWSRAHGWAVETPRIPGLHYPTWNELQARWARKRAEFERQLGQDPPQP